MEKNPLIGKVITAVWLADDKKAIKFDVDDSEPVIARADGDCCSSSWIENVEAPEVLVGSSVVSVESLDLSGANERNDEYGDLVQHYGLRIRTALGACTLDYRNESNGYYGGSLSWPGDDFYGGVHGQNVSNDDWRRLAPATSADAVDPHVG